MLIVYARDDPRAMRTSSGPALQAHEVVAISVDRSGAVGAEIKVTLARDVSVLAVFPEPPAADSDTPALSVLFSELALDQARRSGVPPVAGDPGTGRVRQTRCWCAARSRFRTSAPCASAAS